MGKNIKFYSYQNKSGQVVHGIKSDNGEFYSIQDLEEHFNKRRKKGENMDDKTITEENTINFLEQYESLKNRDFVIHISGKDLIDLYNYKQKVERNMFIPPSWTGDALSILICCVNHTLKKAVPVKEEKEV